MASITRIALGIVSCITTIIFIIALMQLELVSRLENHDDINSGGGGGGGGSNGGSKEAIMLRLGLIRPEILSWSPRIIHFHNFLSIEECKYLIALATPRLPDTNNTTRKGSWNKVRTSSSMFLNPKEKEYPIIKAIENRISIYTQIPVENGESLQVIRYEVDQFYIPHKDYFSNKTYISRIATVLMYLNDVIEGGETYFPMVGSDRNCSCGGETVKGLSVKPIKGDAVLFWSMRLNGNSDPNTEHGGCKVVNGMKWSATKWLRQRPC